MPYAIRLPLVLKTVVVHLLLPAALAISLGAAGGVVHADVLPPQMQDASESAAAAEAELTPVSYTHLTLPTTTLV